MQAKNGIPRWIGMVVWLLMAAAPFLVSQPENMSLEGWLVLGVFAATIVSFLLKPLPMGPMVLLGLVVLSIAQELDSRLTPDSIGFKVMMSGYGEKVVWLVVAALLIAGAVVRTGFGRRIALTLVTKLGKSTLGLGFSIAASELILGPVIPSNTARGGGIHAPIVHSLSDALGSTPAVKPERAGRYLSLVGAHANLITAAMFLTGMAANGLVSAAADDVFGIEFGWGTWALGAIVPGLVGLALLPPFLYKLSPPTITDASAAQDEAHRELGEMGTWSRGQITMGVVFVSMLSLWCTAPWHGLHPGLIALVGVCALLISGADRWQDMTADPKPWDTLIWLGGLLAMANSLKNQGVVDYFASVLQSQVSGMAPMAVVLVLGLVYFYSMYGFSMFTARISAMVGVLFAVALAADAPPMLMIGMIAYFSNLCGCITNYSTGPVVIYFGLGYVPAGQWFRVGALVSLFHLTIWLGVGLAWWKLLGWW